MNLKFADADKERAYIQYRNELISPLNMENMFKAGIYVILSAKENYQKQKNVYEQILENDFLTPEKIIDDKATLYSLISKISYPKSKVAKIHGFAVWWQKSDLLEKILDDSSNLREHEFRYRDILAKESPGLGPKCASLFMMKCGYENVVPIDMWTIRFLEQCYGIKTGSKIRGVSFNEHLRLEKEFQKIAASYEVSPVMLHSMLWAKFSTWKKLETNATQLELF